MAIKVSNPETRPAMVMGGLHVDQLLLRISRTTGLKAVNAQGVVYGRDEAGKQVFNDKNMLVAEGDFDTKAVVWAIQNGQATDPADAIAKLTAAKLAVTQSAPDVFTLMAYFEQATGVIFEIAGKAEVSGIE